MGEGSCDWQLHHVRRFHAVPCRRRDADVLGGARAPVINEMQRDMSRPAATEGHRLTL
jgi:hypothetical protein